MQPSPEQIAGMTSDPATLTAGRRLAGVENWKELGQYSATLWGICRGSADYQVRVDLESFAYRCSCPSRKFPCKHILGLLMLAATRSDAIPEDEPPDWVSEWLEKRQARKSQRPNEGPVASGQSADVKGQQRRQQRREANIQAGLDRLDLWMTDIVRNGLAGVERKPRSFWEDQAKRLVDAQVPGIAGRIRRLADVPGSSPDWPEKLLDELGRIKLLVHAYRRIAELPAELQQNVRQLVGWNVSQQELDASGELVEDKWALCGQWVDEDGRLRTQRTWAVGRKTGRTALILQFAPGIQPFAETILPGYLQHATLCFYPGTVSLRARFQERFDAIVPITSRVPGHGTIDQLLESAANMLAELPWMGACGCVLHDVTLVVKGDSWFVRDQTGAALPLAGGEYWRLLAITGGHPCDVAGEWFGGALRPLGVLHRGRYQLV